MSRLRFLLAGICTLSLGLLLGGTVPAVAQSLEASIEMRIVVHEAEQSVYVYHTGILPLGYGFNIYRKATVEDDFVRLNLEPVRGTLSGDEFRAAMGTLYDDIEGDLLQESPNGTLARLRSDEQAANLLTFMYPQVALALGRLYIDRDAIQEEAVIYRIELVDDTGKPTGISIEKSHILIPVIPKPPIDLRATNVDREITLFWKYPTPSFNEDDKVFRFEAYRIDPLSNKAERLHENVILRNNALFEYSATYQAITTGQTERFFVVAIDISGQRSEPSETYRYELVDNTPPTAVLGLDAVLLPEGRVRLTWDARIQSDISGYHIYRSDALLEQSRRHRLTPTTLSSFESTFIDALPDTLRGLPVYYWVSAVDASENESDLGNSAIVLTTDESGPNAPLALEATLSEEGTVALAWQAPAGRRSSWDGFIVTRERLTEPITGLEIRLHEAVLDTTGYIDQPVETIDGNGGLSLRYAVRAVDGSGNLSQASRVDVVMPDREAPAPPNGLLVQNNHASRAIISWNPSPSTDVMQYILYRKPINSEALTVSVFDRSTRYTTVTDLEHGVSYQYWVTAADQAGNESSFSETVTTALRDTYPPRQVRNIRIVQLESGTPLIYWEPVHVHDFAGYRVYSSEHMNGVYVPLEEALLQGTRWTPGSLEPGHWYQVRAVDLSGNESPASIPVQYIRSEDAEE